MLKPQAGEWYIITTCERCKSLIFLFPDLTEGRGSLKATYIITCPHCNHKGGHEGRHYQHPDGKRRAIGNHDL
jgi:DNA-directed RNA polymerase subunit RPC12/RpoP